MFTFRFFCLHYKYKALDKVTSKRHAIYQYNNRISSLMNWPHWWNGLKKWWANQPEKSTATLHHKQKKFRRNKKRYGQIRGPFIYDVTQTESTFHTHICINELLKRWVSWFIFTCGTQVLKQRLKCAHESLFLGFSKEDLLIFSK